MGFLSLPCRKTLFSTGVPRESSFTLLVESLEHYTISTISNNENEFAANGFEKDTIIVTRHVCVMNAERAITASTAVQACSTTARTHHHRRLPPPKKNGAAHPAPPTAACWACSSAQGTAMSAAGYFPQRTGSAAHQGSWPQRWWRMQRMRPTRRSSPA